VKYQQKANDDYLMDNHDRECMLQEMRKRNMNWSPEGENPSINKIGLSERSSVKQDKVLVCVFIFMFW